MKYFRKVWDAFIGTFKDIRIPFVIVIAYEILFFLAVTGIFFLFQEALMRVAQNFASVNPYSVSPENVSVMKSFFAQSIAVTVGLLFVIFVVYTIIQGLAWLQILERKHTLRYFTRFFLLHLAWLIPWLVIMWFFIVGLKGTFATVGLTILGILFTYLTFIMQHSFVRDPHLGIRKALGAAFSIGIGRIYLFIIPLLLAAVVFIIWSQVWRLVPQIENLGFGLIILASLVFAPFLAWFKFYIDKLLAAFA